MTRFHVVESGWLLDEAKRAALDAVGGYDRLNAYTIGVAVQAAAGILRLGGTGGAGGSAAGPDPIGPGATGALDVDAVEVTPRLRALESVVAAARRLHGDGNGDGCELCTALGHLAAIDRRAS